MFIPAGFAHGFVVVSDEAVFAYKCTEYYAPACECSIRWDDPELAIAWPVAGPRLSPKDLAAPTLCEISHDRLPSLIEPKVRVEPGHAAGPRRPVRKYLEGASGS
jgi:dTDP-4-dehydrorhamnose 3,5-epimerase